MYTQARRTYPIYAAVILLTIMIFGALVCVTAESEPEYTQKTNRAAIPVYTDISAPNVKTQRIVNPERQPEEATLVATIEPETPTYILDIPLDQELQEYIHKLCEEREVPYTLVVAMIEQESSYRSSIISKTDDYGLMQINTINHDTIGETLGITDFLDPEQNCNAGIYIISKYYRKYQDLHKALMAYNLGETGAKRNWNNGIYSTAYSERVIEIMQRLEKKGK